MALTKKEKRDILAIAVKHICAMEDRGDFETRHSDSEDFLDIAVWSLESALEAAYELGKRNGGK